ncbi:MAG: cytochrome b/b6 domain-containing protein [Verrucomicrobiota bacterium]
MKRTVKVLIWDLPIRVFHWGFAGSLIASLYLGTYYHPEGDVFKFHMLCGILAGVFLVMRLFLGFIGSRHYRWRHYLVSPWKLGCYVVDTIRGVQHSQAEVNPGTACVSVLMYLTLGGLLWTGFTPDLVEVWHARLANVLISLIVLHLGGLILQTLRHRDPIALAMVTGRKQAPQDDAIGQPHSVVGWVLLVVSLLILAVLFYYFDTNTARLSVPMLPAIDFPEMQKG